MKLFLLAKLLVPLKLIMQKQDPEIDLNNLNDIQEIERRRIASDIHDHIGPTLSALKLKIDSIHFITDPLEIKKTVNEVNANIDNLVQDVRRVIYNLSPTNIEKYGLSQAIEDFKLIVERRNNVKFEFTSECIEKQMKENARLNIYRIIAEMINNSIKHSACSKIRLTLKTYGDKTMIVYSDNGSFQSKPHVVGIGMGLKNIESRVTSFNGRLFCDNSFSNGAFYKITFDNHKLIN